MVAANTPLRRGYQALLRLADQPAGRHVHLDKTLLIWINDLLMAIFFLLVGLEIKREVVAGELSDPAKVALPAVAALGGMVVPAAIYASLNWHDPSALRGWAIPSATDIAFALGVLSLFGKRVPVGLKVFLMTLAVLDDLGAIVIIALFYTSDLSLHGAGAGAGIAHRRAGRAESHRASCASRRTSSSARRSGCSCSSRACTRRWPASSRRCSYRRGIPQHAGASAARPARALAASVGRVRHPAGVRVRQRGREPRRAEPARPAASRSRSASCSGLFVGKQVGVFAFAWLAVQVRAGAAAGRA